MGKRKTAHLREQFEAMIRKRANDLEALTRLYQNTNWESLTKKERAQFECLLELYV